MLLVGYGWPGPGATFPWNREHAFFLFLLLLLLKRRLDLVPMRLAPPKFDASFPIHQVSDDAVVVATTAGAQAHMRGERDPNSGEPFPCDIEAALHNLKSALLPHDHRVHTGVPGAVPSKHNPKDYGI